MKRSLKLFQAFFAALPLIAAPNAQAAPELSLAKKVEQALRSNQEAPSYEAWVAEGLTPAALFGDVRALTDSSVRAAAWKELCTKLSQIGTIELALFQTEIEESATDPAFTCSSELVHRVTDFYEVQALYLMDGQSDNKTATAPQAPPSKVKNETREIEGTPVVSPGFMVGGATPPGKGAFMKHANLGAKEICITFDDGPVPDRTVKVLDDLDAADVRVNFFEVGRNAEARPDLSTEVAHRGHIVGSHSMIHPILTSIGFDAAKKEILGGREAVAKASGYEIPFFRYPGGGWDRALMAVTDAAGLATFFWDMDTRDWQIHDPAQLLSMALHELSRAGNGTILFHDTQPATWVIIPQFLNELAARDYTVVQFAPKKAPSAAAPLPISHE